MAAYVQALCAELDLLAAMPAADLPQEHVPEHGLTAASLRPTIFLGGGTPSMLPIELLAQVLAAAHQVVALAGAEVTLEANPGTVLGRSYLRELRDLGINRLSMGVQSLHDPTLKVLGRIHTAAEAYQSFEDARAAGFDNINLDFIFGLPGQTMEQWHVTLAEITRWQAEHFSLYSLILEPSTPLFAQVMSGRVSVPDDDLSGAMYEQAIEQLGNAGYVQYEISNWARGESREQQHTSMAAGLASQTGSAYVCQHNIAYWLNVDYLAAGAGAHGHVYPQRFANVLGIDDYIAAVARGSAIAELTALSAADLAAETMFMGLRLTEGVGYAHFQERCGQPMQAVYGTELAELEALGLLLRDQHGVRLTPRGRMLGNRVFERFV